MTYASFWQRVGAFIIDVLLLGVISLPLWIWLLLSVRNTPPVSLYFYLLGMFIIWYFFSLFYFIGYWAWRGQTPGKMVAGIKVARQDSRPIGLARAVLRYLIGYSLHYIMAAFLFIPVVALLVVIIIQKQKRGVHDLIAGSSVIRVR